MCVFFSAISLRLMWLFFFCVLYILVYLDILWSRGWLWVWFFPCTTVHMFFSSRPFILLIRIEISMPFNGKSSFLLFLCLSAGHTLRHTLQCNYRGFMRAMSSHLCLWKIVWAACLLPMHIANCTYCLLWTKKTVVVYRFESWLLTWT